MITSILFFLFMAAASSAQTLRLDMDYAAFKYDADHAAIEVYYQLSYDSIPNITGEQNIVPWVTRMSLVVYQYDSTFGTNRWVNRSEADLKSGHGLEYLGMVKFQVPTGGFRVCLSATDSTFQGESDTVKIEFPVWPYHPKQTILSDIELSNAIKGSQEQQASLFYKNGLIVYPVPDKTILTSNNKLFYYLEVYHLVSSKASGDYYLGTSILNDRAEKIAQTVYRKYSKDIIIDAMAAFGEVEIDTLTSGNYILTVELLDSTGRRLTSREKPFVIQKVEQVKQNNFEAQFENSIFALMDSVEIEKEVKTLQLIASNEIIKIIKKLDNLPAKRRFLHNYWVSQDPDQRNPRNEKYLIHHDRVRIAEESFGSLLKKGWRTDRGRVIILYGPPDNIERFPDSIDKYPHEIWYYDSIENSVKFVFADYSGQGFFTQIFSDKQGETYNPSWESTLYRTGFSSE